jgi:hypothetical protein
MQNETTVLNRDFIVVGERGVFPKSDKYISYTGKSQEKSLIA